MTWGPFQITATISIDLAVDNLHPQGRIFNINDEFYVLVRPLYEILSLQPEVLYSSCLQKVTCNCNQIIWIGPYGIFLYIFFFLVGLGHYYHQYFQEPDITQLMKKSKFFPSRIFQPIPKCQSPQTISVFIFTNVSPYPFYNLHQPVTLAKQIKIYSLFFHVCFLRPSQIPLPIIKSQEKSPVITSQQNRSSENW